MWNLSALDQALADGELENVRVVVNGHITTVRYKIALSI